LRSAPTACLRPWKQPAGLGLALLPTYLGDDPHHGLVRVGEQIAELRSDVWVLTHPDLMRAARIKVFTTLMVKYLKPMLREGGALPCPALADT
jgi:DNA-binding transcriptional LysR family regulator